MRGAFGKPQGQVARVNIGQPIVSIRCKEANKEHAVEALRRSKFKFPGRQKVLIYYLVFHAGRYFITDIPSNRFTFLRNGDLLNGRKMNMNKC